MKASAYSSIYPFFFFLVDTKYAVLIPTDEHFRDGVNARNGVFKGGEDEAIWAPRARLKKVTVSRVRQPPG